MGHHIIVEDILVHVDSDVPDHIPVDDQELLEYVQGIDLTQVSTVSVKLDLDEILEGNVQVLLDLVKQNGLGLQVNRKQGLAHLCALGGFAKTLEYLYNKYNLLHINYDEYNFFTPMNKENNIAYYAAIKGHTNVLPFQKFDILWEENIISNANHFGNVKFKYLAQQAYNKFHAENFSDHPTNEKSIPSLQTICTHVLAADIIYKTQINTNINNNNNNTQKYTKIVKKLGQLPENLVKEIFTQMSQDSIHGIRCLMWINKEIPEIGKLISPEVWLDACNSSEQRTRDFVYKKFPYDTCVDQPLIDVFEQYENFIIQPKCEMEEEAASFFYQPRDIGKPSIVSHQQFLKQFKIFTREFFEGFDFSNVIVIGGSVIGSLLPVDCETDEKLQEFYDSESPFKSSDIDIYIYGLDRENFQKKVEYIHKYFSEKLIELGESDREVYNATSLGQIVFFALYPFRTIQIVTSHFISKWQVLTGVDVDCSAFAWDGNTLWTTPRGILAVNYRWTVANPELYKIRGSPQYERRLIKYSKRGFTIVDREYNWRGMEYDEHAFRHTLCGASLIAAAFHNRKILKELQKSEYDGILYGPDVTYEDVENHLEECASLSDVGYGPSDDCLQLGTYEEGDTLQELPELPYCVDYYLQGGEFY